MNHSDGVTVEPGITSGPNYRRYDCRRIKTKYVPYILVGPAVVFVLAVLANAVASGLVMSLFRIDFAFRDRPFVGLSNYVYLFTNERFLRSLVRSLLFVLASVSLGFFLSMVFALSLKHCGKFGNQFKGIILVPYLISGIASATMFRFVFSGSAGIVNMLLQLIGFETVMFLSDPGWAVFVTILANVWFVIPFPVLILVAGMETIDEELYEAGIIDGANALALFSKITLPLIRNIIGISLTWLSFASFNMFDIVLPLTGGGPLRATEYMAVYMYRVSFYDFRYSLGSAVMVLILLLNMSASVFFLKVFRASE